MPRNRESEAQEENLQDKKPIELRHIARDKGIENADRYDKAELLDLLADTHDEQQPSEQQPSEPTQ